MTRTIGSKRFSLFQVLAAVAVLATGCFEGAERDKPAPPGNLGGLCLAPDGHCTQGQCNRDKNYCFDAVNPCEGFFCGGEERGVCILDEAAQPSCVCNPGFNNDSFALYCCPDPGTFGEVDPNCAPSTPSDDDGDDGDDGGSNDGSSSN